MLTQALSGTQTFLVWHVLYAFKNVPGLLDEKDDDSA